MAASLNPAGGAPITTDSTNNVGATVGLSVTIIDYLEAYVAANASATGDNNNHPTLLQEMGDMTIGVKGAYDFGTKFFWPFAAAELRFCSRLVIDGTIGLRGRDDARGAPLAAGRQE